MPMYRHLSNPYNPQFITKSIALFSPEQVYAIEKSWFDNGNRSDSLMQQAAWQSAYWINQNITSNACISPTQQGASIVSPNNVLSVCIWVGSGNNGGDGWLVAYYLRQLGAQVVVIEVGEAATEDAKSAKNKALESGIRAYPFSEFIGTDDKYCLEQCPLSVREAEIYVDALFGIGLDRMPVGNYEQAIEMINERKRSFNDRLKVISIDIPSGLVAGTGQVFEGCAVKADVTLCLVARKVGLHIKDAADYCGQIIDVPLIPSVLTESPVAWLQHQASPLAQRENNTHKGSFGHALIIGGNQIDGSQGMGGAAILSASTAFATGVGKLTVACHKAFHSSVIGSVPNAMSLDLHHTQAVRELIKQSDSIAIGMGLGRDDLSLSLFEQYSQQAIEQEKDLIIDADGLYHLATLADKTPKLVAQLATHAEQHEVWYTPHSGEAARLLNVETSKVEQDRLEALSSLREKFKGSWLLKGAGSIIMTEQQTFVCGAGNPGMATAGMGDVLSGLAAGLLAQSALAKNTRSLQQAVMLHAMAGDKLQQQKGTWAVQASDMPAMVGEVLKELTLNSVN